MQAGHSRESSILGLFKLLTAAVLVCKGKTVWDTSHLLCTSAKGWSPKMQSWPWDPSSLESSWSCLTPGHHPGWRDKCKGSFPSAQAWQLPQASSNSQFFQFPIFTEEPGTQNAEFFSGKCRDNHVQPSRKPRAGISWHLQSQKSESISWLICCPLPVKILSLKHSAASTKAADLRKKWILQRTNHSRTTTSSIKMTPVFLKRNYSMPLTLLSKNFNRKQLREKW